MMITPQIIKLIIIINIFITSTTSQPTIIRCCHGSTIANNKIYFGGGGTTGPTNNIVYTNDFFSLDLTKPFSTSSPTTMPYDVLVNVPVKSVAHIIVYANNANNAKNAKGGTIYFFGGHRESPEGNPIYGYVPEKNAWSSVTPKTNDVIIPVNSTTRTVGITDSSLDTIYIFDNGTMFIYDVVNNFWNAGKLAPLNLEYYAAVMLNTSEIAYIGGYTTTANVSTNVPIEQILLYNTKLSLWYSKASRSIDGAIPSTRRGHTASMAPDGRIFVYGGYDGAKTASAPTFTVLEYINSEFVWSTPQLFNQSYVMRIFHTSHVVGNYLIVAFGRNLTANRLNTMDLIDISSRDNYHVVADYVPTTTTANPPITTATTTTTTTASPQPSLLSPTTSIIIASVSGSVALLIIVGGVFFLVRRHRQHAVPTPGNDDYLPSTSDINYERNSINTLPYTTPHTTNDNYITTPNYSTNDNYMTSTPYPPNDNYMTYPPNDNYATAIPTATPYTTNNRNNRNNSYMAATRRNYY